MNLPKSKNVITSLILGELVDITHPWKEFLPDQLEGVWWQSGRTGRSLRLTDEGKLAFELAQIESYDFDLDAAKITQKSSWNKFTLDLTKKIDCPYYIGVMKNSTRKTFIRVYDSKTAMMITLYGDVLEYVTAR